MVVAVVTVLWFGVALPAPALGQPPSGTPAQQINQIINQPVYASAEWGYLVTDAGTGRTVQQLGPDRRLYVPGSSSKLWALTAAWKTLGPDSRITTPVYAIGQRSGATLRGSVVLVGQGDLTLGGRTKPDGTIDFRNIDHTVANAIPDVQLTPEDPLAGLNALAAQVRARGITSIVGDVVVDERLFGLDPTFEAPPLPIMINDNLIDVVATPAATAGTKNAVVTTRALVAPYVLSSAAVDTTAPGSPDTFSAVLGADGKTITVSGAVPAGGPYALRTVTPVDRVAFARAAFIEALQRAGVRVSHTANGPGPDPGTLSTGPNAYPAAAQVASIVSPTYAENAKLILKVSHNPGASLTICLLAVRLGSSDCEAGWSTVKAFLTGAGINLTEVALGAPDGGSEANRESPRAIVDLLTWWLGQPDGPRFRQALAVPGVDGTDAADLINSPARGKISGKDGLRAAGDALNQRILVAGAAYAGYLDLGNGHTDVVAMFMNGATAADTPELLRRFEDVIDVTGLLWQQASQP